MDTTKEYLKRILKVLIYIDEHIDEAIAIDQLAKIAYFSHFHFHRIFQLVVGENVYKYMKRLRLEKAAGKLRYTNQPITEIALDACYGTPSSFTKAFKQFMGKSPRDYRLLNEVCKTIAKKIKELPMIKPDNITEDLPDLNLLFIRKYGNYDESSREAWKAMKAFIDTNHLSLSELRYFGLPHDDPKVTSEDKLRYDACIVTNQTVKETGEVGCKILKGGKYAIFTHNGSYNTLLKTFDSIILKWFPKSKASFDEIRTFFCEYFNMEYRRTDPDKLVTKIYIPLN